MTLMRILQKNCIRRFVKDAADQKLQKYNLTNALKDPEETGEYSSASLSMDFYHVSADWKNVYDRLDDYYTNMGESVETSRPYGGSAYVSFGKDCTNIINTLIECGVIDDVSEIHFFKFRRENITEMKSAGLYNFRGLL